MFLFLHKGSSPIPKHKTISSFEKIRLCKIISCTKVNVFQYFCSESKNTVYALLSLFAIRSVRPDKFIGSAEISLEKIPLQFGDLLLVQLLE